MTSEPLYDLIRNEGPAASIPAGERHTPDADAVVRLVRQSFGEGDPRRVLAAWDDAGARHDAAALDAVLATLAQGGWVPFAGAHARRKLREGARAVLRTTRQAGTVELAAAVLGAAGTEEDAVPLETFARHPAFTLHAATALANLAHWKGRAALLRLLTKTDGAERVVIIDRLLPHIRQPAVSLALVRDALKGLSAEHAAEVAGDIAGLCDVQGCIDDPKSAEDLRAGARLVLAHARRPA